MIHLVYGGSGSGKSAFAEKTVMDLDTEKRFYLATMKIFGQEGLEKVRRHKELRAGKGFITLEHETLDEIDSICDTVSGSDSTVLLECMSNLVANEMFRDEDIVPAEKVTDKVCREIGALGNASGNLVIVSSNVFEDGLDYDPTTEKYMEALGAINAAVADIADRVTEVVCGIPVIIKNDCTSTGYPT